MDAGMALTLQNYPMETFLTVLSGVSWLIAYALAIRVGFRDKIHAMPTMALAFNLFWELWY